MTTQRDDGPYGRFEFLVELGAGGTARYQGGFHEVSGLGSALAMTDPREAAPGESLPRKLAGLVKSSEVTLKRGVAGAADLHEWLEQARNGEPGALRTVTISLQRPDRTGIAQTWRLGRARIVKHTSGPMSAKGTDVALEELVLAHEGLEIE